MIAQGPEPGTGWFGPPVDTSALVKSWFVISSTPGGGGEEGAPSYRGLPGW